MRFESRVNLNSVNIIISPKCLIFLVYFSSILNI